MNYNDILNEEYAKAKSVVANAKYHRTFHRGIFDYISDNGWEVVYYTDNSIEFYGKSRLFCFRATHFTTQMEWTLTDCVRIEFQNISWYRGREWNSTTVRVSKFDECMERKGEEFHVEPILKPYRSSREKEREFSKYIVTESYGCSDPIRVEFDNLDDAKKFAYEYADEICKMGKEMNDDLSRYYKSSPIDASKEYPTMICAYKTYEYYESAKYVFIEGR